MAVEPVRKTGNVQAGIGFSPLKLQTWAAGPHPARKSNRRSYVLPKYDLDPQCLFQPQPLGLQVEEKLRYDGRIPFFTRSLLLELIIAVLIEMKIRWFLVLLEVGINRPQRIPERTQFGTFLGISLERFFVLFYPEPTGEDVDAPMRC